MLFFDIETRSALDLPSVGLMRYAMHPTTEIIALGFVYENKPYIWVPEHRRGTCESDVFDEGRHVWNEYVATGEPVIAWNAQFDRTVLEHVVSPLVWPTIDQTLCAAAQAESFSLPGGLNNAARALGLEIRKQPNGKKLIAEFCDANKPWDPHAHDLVDFWRYCQQDVRVMMEVWDHCRKWAGPEWADYHVVERMNARGLPIDERFVKEAVSLGQTAREELDHELKTFTDDACMTLRAHKRKAEWLAEKLEGSPLLNVIKTPTGHTTNTVALADLKAAAEEAEELPDTWPEVEVFLDILDRGAGVATDKFARMLQTHHEGRVYHQYRCSPTITGRHASRGVQFDNVLRETLDDPEKAIEEAKHGRFREHVNMPVNKALARLIRPTITSEQGLTWGDWSSIEARLLPWLARSRDADAYLDTFREGRDIYVRQAAGIFGISEDEIMAGLKAGLPSAKEMRFIGKVATLSLGYQGGAGALMRMAKAYGAPMDPAQAEEIKERFRWANPWLTQFWQNIKEGFSAAARNDGIPFHAGRVKYVRIGGTLFCQLPCKRVIAYPEIHWGRRWHKVWEKWVEGWMYRKAIGGGRTVKSQLYAGIAVENITQGTAASLLRDLMRRLDDYGYTLLASRHDEVLIEGRCAAALRAAMLRSPEWAAGLPLAADVEEGVRYGK